MEGAGELVDLEITDLTREGLGVARLGSRVVFVAGGLPGDRARVRLEPSRRGPLRGVTVERLHSSPGRRRPPCILADHCGGCSLQEYDDAAERAWKRSHLRETLRRIAHLDPPLRPLEPPVRSLGYRNRAVIPLERSADGRLRAGYYRRGSHRIVNMNRCPVLDPRLDALIAPLKADLEASGWPVDRHGRGGAAGEGGLRHLALRVGHHSGEVLLALVASHDRLPGLEERAAAWRERWPQVVGVALNLQPQPTNRLFGDRTRCLAGRDWLIERFAGLTYRIGVSTFFQVHTAEAERVTELLAEALAGPPGRLLDAYCGIGTFSLPLAARRWRVRGIEQHPAAVALARLNAAENGLADRAEFLQGDVAALLALELAGPERSGVDVLLLDPPRKGLDPAVLEAILAEPPPRLVYLSCDPATLSRDLQRLCGAGPYRPAWVQPLDFFPNTTHVETLAVLERS